MSCLCFAQEMRPPKKPKLSRHTDISRVLLEDQTSTYKYIDVDYTCHNFARTLYLQRSSLVLTLDDYNLAGIKEDWGHEIIREEPTAKLPIYMVNLANKKVGFYHTVNAVQINAEDPKALSSYIFIEPQTDEIFETVTELYTRYAGYFDETPEGKILEIDVGVFTEFKHNGYIYQSKDETFFKETYSPEDKKSEPAPNLFLDFMDSGLLYERPTDEMVFPEQPIY